MLNATGGEATAVGTVPPVSALPLGDTGYRPIVPAPSAGLYSPSWPMVAPCNGWPWIDPVSAISTGTGAVVAGVRLGRTNLSNGISCSNARVCSGESTRSGSMVYLGMTPTPGARPPWS